MISANRATTVNKTDGLPLLKRYWAILATALGVGMSVIDGTIANVALPTIARDLGTEPSVTIWVVNAYQLAITISLLSFSSWEISMVTDASTCRELQCSASPPDLRPFRFLLDPDGSSHHAGLRSGSHHQREHSSATYHLSEKVSGERNGDKRPCRGSLDRCRTDHRVGYPVARLVALAICHQCPVRHRRPGDRHLPPARQPGESLWQALRQSQLPDERADLRTADLLVGRDRP